MPDATSPRRFVTTVPQQALFLMNSPFLHEQARRLAAVGEAGHGAASRIAATAPADETAERVRRLYRRVFSRRRMRVSWRWRPSSCNGKAGLPPAICRPA